MSYGAAAYGGLTGASFADDGIGAGAQLSLHQRHQLTGHLFVRDGRYAQVTVSCSRGRMRLHGVGIDVGRGAADWNDKR